MFPFLLILFVGVPLLELALLLRIARAIALGPTLGLILLTGVLGAALARREGARTLMRIQQTLSRGELPAQAMVEGVLIFIAGVVLVTPGVITDAFGFCLLIPPIRAWVARRMHAYFRKRTIVTGHGFHVSTGGFDAGGFDPGEVSRQQPADDDIIDVPYRDVTDKRLGDE